MRPIRFVMLTFVLLAAGCGGDTSRAPETEAGAESAPDFSVQTFDDGAFALSEQKGKIVVLNFFESW